MQSKLSPGNILNFLSLSFFHYVFFFYLVSRNESRCSSWLTRDWFGKRDSKGRPSPLMVSVSGEGEKAIAAGEVKWQRVTGKERVTGGRLGYSLGELNRGRSWDAILAVWQSHLGKMWLTVANLGVSCAIRPIWT